MTYAAQVYLCRAINLARTRAGLAPLRLSAELMHNAQHRAAEIGAAGAMDHHRGAGVVDMYWGEILGETGGLSGRAASDYVVRLWLASPDHRPILLGRRWTYLGGGVTVAGGRTWYAGIFGHR
jgi:uncharacterized protein YkwD